VVTLLDGRPFTAFGSSSSNDRTGQDFGSGISRADCTGPHVYHTQSTGQAISPSLNAPPYIERTGFVTSALNTVGNCGRNNLVGPGLAQVDLSLFKTTRITEQVKFQFRWEVFNVFNRANLSNFFASQRVTSSSFGRITATSDIFNPVISQGGPRAMQWVFKVLF
jgi:hypothetical protein